ncbi:hypothetical protein D3C71_1287080 [compost metagenome]
MLYANLSFFKARADVGASATGLAARFQDAVVEATSVEALAAKARAAIDNAGKAEFALDLLFSEDVRTLTPPAYIRCGLEWLIAQLKRKEAELAPKAPA